MPRILGLVAAITIVVAVPAAAGGGYGPAAGVPSCPGVENAQELVSYTNRRALKTAVYSRYLDAVEISNSRTAYFSATPLFLWANQAKITCAKAYGYLRKRQGWGRASYPMVQKCECFYLRMQAHARRR